MRILFFLSLVFFLGCNSQEPNAVNTSILENVNKGTFKIYADSNTAFIFNQVKDCYESAFPEAHLDIVYTSGANAINKIIKDSARLLVLDRMLSKQEWEELFVTYQTRPLEHVFAFDAIALVKPKKDQQTVIQWNAFKDEIKRGQVKFITLKSYEGLVKQMAQLTGITAGALDIKIASDVSELNDFLAFNNSYYGILPFSLVSDQDNKVAREIASLFHWQGFEMMIEEKIDTIYPSQSTIRTQEYPLIKPYNIVACKVTRQNGIGMINFCFKTQVGKLVLKAGLIPKIMPQRAILLQEGNL